MWKNTLTPKTDNTAYDVAIFVGAIILLFGISYLIIVGLTALVLWGFSIDINAWKAGVGVMASMLLLGSLFSGRR